MKEEQPTLGLSERSKLIGKMWGSLEPAKKQVIYGFVSATVSA